jgi:hypothetical protein
MRPFTLKLVCVLAFAFSTVLPAHAQVSDVTNSTSTPIQGAGHDYIKMFSETTDPANGTVSIRIGLPVPPGRPEPDALHRQTTRRRIHPRQLRREPLGLNVRPNPTKRCGRS